MELLWLGEPACHDPALAGGKAASLSRLAAAHRVPPGLCVPALVDIGRPDDGPPAGLVSGVAAAYRALADRVGCSEPAVAVRSSATDEDGTGASFAGQYETILNVRGTEAVVDAALRCWAAARTERLRGYRQRQGLPAEGARLAILVQRLVHAEVSAVAFSANPVTGNRDEVIVNASWGLGESIVGGSVTPDEYVVRRSDGAVTGRSISQKWRMTVPVASGTREVDVPPALATMSSLDDRQIVEVARLALSLESQTGAPVDVECAYEADTLYLLQCRPITTLR